MELRQLRYFAAVARHQHFTRASEELLVAQPALSHQIKQLERELGVTLLQRTSRRVTLTDAGEAFLERAERILAEVDGARIAMQDREQLRRGRVVLGVLPSVEERQLPPLLASFHRRYAGIEILMREETTQQLLEMLSAGDIDVALVSQTAASDAVPAGVAVEAILTGELVLALPADHALVGRGSVALSELGEERFVLLKPGSPLRQTLMDASAAAGFRPYVAIESGACATVRALVAEGLGVAVLPRIEAERDGLPPLATVAFEPPSLNCTVALAYRNAGSLPAAVRAFVAFTRDFLRGHRWQEGES